MSARVCVSENLVVDENTGYLRMAPWAVPRLVADEKADSEGDGQLLSTTSLPGKLLVDQKVSWRNDTPLDHMVLIRVTRGHKSWITSNPNAIQFRDRWSWAIDNAPVLPTVSGLFNGQTGSAGDTGTNSVAEPNPGEFWHWWGAGSADEWVGPIGPWQRISVWYRMYVWTPPPWSDNANKNNPVHVANGNWARVQLIAFPEQSTLVAG